MYPEQNRASGNPSGYVLFGERRFSFADDFQQEDEEMSAAEQEGAYQGEHRKEDFLIH